MVNKPQALYKEDAQRAFQRDRLLLLDEIRRRQAEEKDAMDCSDSLSSSSSSSSSTPSPAFQYDDSMTRMDYNDMFALLRARHHGGPQNATFERTYTHLLRDAMNNPRRMRGQHTARHQVSSTSPHPPPPPPRTLSASLDTGFHFTCLISSTESGSFISLALVHQIRPRPEIVPLVNRSGERLRFNGAYYMAVGTVTFAMKLAAPDDATKVVEVMITASVVPGLHPDLFLGKEQAARTDLLVPFTV